VSLFLLCFFAFVTSPSLFLSLAFSFINLGIFFFFCGEGDWRCGVSLSPFLSSSDLSTTVMYSTLFSGGRSCGLLCFRCGRKLDSARKIKLWHLRATQLVDKRRGAAAKMVRRIFRGGKTVCREGIQRHRTRRSDDGKQTFPFAGMQYCTQEA
jgi:hypothetical protein